ncbi:MAG: hypothetical protein RMJ98_18265 [Myxococcales bacterium]|nr:hypothetical protein [Polyangiaceae bacterium]MDW8251244.1 hypothetical protein [Myxococcales bacterium]
MRRGFLMVVMGMLGGCSRPSAPEDARTVYDLRCAPCHGASGRGDGPAASHLLPTPRDLSDPDWQDHTEDAYLRKIILNGGLGVGRSTRMPGNPDLAERPEVLHGLVQVIRGFRRP